MRLALALTALLLAVPLAAQEALTERAEQLIERIAKRPDKAWDYAFSLRSMTRGEDGGKVTPLLEKGLDHESPHVRLVCARLLFALGSGDTALETLADLLKSDDDSVLEPLALFLAAEAPDSEQLADRLRDAWTDSGRRAGATRVALCEALHVMTGEQLPLDQLREFTGSGDHDLVARAALALAQLGHAASVDGRLAALAREPGDLGRLARLGREIVKIDQAVQDHKTGVAGAAPEPLIAVQIRAIRQHYADDFLTYNEKRQTTTPENLVDAACRAMATGFDRYGGYMTSAEIAEMNEDQEGRYVGIGAHVAQGEDNVIYITQPIYEGPAYKAGIRTGDRLLGINGADGKRVDLTKLTLEEGVKLVRGPEGTTAVIYVQRRGVDKELVFEIKRQVVHVDTALEEMLPGKVGYVRLTRFGANSGKDMKASLDNLRRQGMESLILDLRGNPGGQLTAVVEIAEQFLPRGKVISTTGGRWGEWKGPQPSLRSRGGEYTEIPLVVLIDGDSASGSEMLSGALKDNNRAVVIGRNTFGKGVGQSFYPVDKSAGSRVLKTTVFSYYLPSGVTIDRHAGVGGVSPHIHVDPQYLQSWQVYAIDKLRKSKRLDDYLDLHYRGEGKALLMRLASFDGLQTQAWPRFDEFYAGLNTRLSPDDVRRELRFALRTRVADDRGAEFTQNYQEDPGILRGVKELFAKAGKDPAQIPEYKAVMK
ncbi:MAG: PDZ domain-containing protein [Planctomycetes bacterium]|nr:PDZ domain-containing protein [Planctomycetota bacterium]MCL4730136.1 S41 family peptidase [Planctomycetota bacterium]